MLILWSHPTWKIFHTLTANMIEELFDEIFKIECIDLFTKICWAIPCGLCRVHAIEKIKKLIKDEIKTARDLEIFFYNFHSDVNAITRNELYPLDKLIKYKQKSVKIAIKEFKNVLEIYYRNPILLNQFNDFTSKYQDKFTHYKKVTNKKDKSKDKLKDKSKDKLKNKSKDKLKNKSKLKKMNNII